MKFRELNFGQRIGWYFSSFVYGLLVFLIPGFNGAYEGLSGVSEWSVVAGILGAAWVLGVIGLRHYIQNKNPADFFDLMGIKRGKSKESHFGTEDR